MALNRGLNQSEDNESQSNYIQNFNKGKLSKQEIKDLEERKTSIKNLTTEKRRLDEIALSELNKMVIAKDEQEAIITLKEYKEFKTALDETDSPEKTQIILNKIKEIPKNKEKQVNIEKTESINLSPEDPKLLNLEKQFNNICEANKDYIGLKQIEGFKQWFREQRRSTPNITALKEIIKRLEGKEISDKNGLAPRIAEFNKLNKLFNKYEISSPLDSEWIRVEGLSERIKFRKNIEHFEKHLEKNKDTGFYSKEAITNMMKAVILGKNPSIQVNLLDKAKAISKKESEAFVHLDSTINIAGYTLRKMSKESKKAYLEYYKSTDLNERSELVTNWKTIVEHEANLSKDLQEIYKEQPKELLHLALKSFEEMDFMTKQKSLEEHKNLIEKNETKESTEKNLIIKAAHAKIDAAANEEIIAKGENNTQGKYKKFFSNMDNFINQETGKKGDINELKKGFKILTEQKVNIKYKNLSAYKKLKNDFEKDLKTLKEINPHINNEELNKWKKNYNNAGWTNRNKIHQSDLKNFLNKERKNKAKEVELKQAVNLNETKESNNLNINKTIKAVQELLLNEQGAEAMKLLLKYNENDPDNPKVLFWIQTVASYMKEFGTGKKVEEKTEDEMENIVEEISKSDSEIESEIEEKQIKELNIEGAEMSETRHNKTLSSRDRAKKESLNNINGLEEKLTINAYDEMDEKYILGNDSKSTKIDDINFSSANMINQEKETLKNKTYRQQDKLDSNEGFTNINLKDKNGRRISAREAKALHEQEKEKLSNKITKKAEDKFKLKNTSKKDDISNLYTRISAKRKAKKLIDKKTKEKIEL